MKDFHYYAYPKEGDKTLYPDFNAHMMGMKYAIDNTPMTTSDREKAITGIRPATQEWFDEAIKPFEIQRNKLIQEFWQDCRLELRYYEILDEQGMVELESFVWEKVVRSSKDLVNQFMDTYYALEKQCKLLKLMLASNKRREYGF